MNLNESNLMQWAAVLDAGTISGGAQALGQTQPAVSRSLAMLEARIGQALFVKGKRSLQATPLAAHGHAMRVASRRTTDTVKVKVFLTGTRELVRVGVSPSSWTR